MTDLTENTKKCYDMTIAPFCCQHMLQPRLMNRCASLALEFRDPNPTLIPQSPTDG